VTRGTATATSPRLCHVSQCATWHNVRLTRDNFIFLKKSKKLKKLKKP